MLPGRADRRYPGTLSVVSLLVGPLALGLLVLANAFFVLGEFSLITVDRGRVERLAGSGDRRAGRVLGALRMLTTQLSGAQLGITLSSLLVGFLAEPALGALLRPLLQGIPGASEGLTVSLSLAIAFVLSTAVQMVVGEQVPKSVAIAYPLPTAILVIPLLRAFCWVCGPAIAVLNGGANAVVRRLGVEPREEIAAARSIAELEVVIRTSAEQGALDRPTARLLWRAARFRRKTAVDALVPRVELVALPRRATAADLLRTAAASRHHRFPVYGDGLDDIVGVVGVRDALGVEPPRRAEVRLADLAQPPLAVPESVHLDRLVVQLRASGQTMAVAVDEYGGTAGIVTLEDLLEEAAGEIDVRPTRPAAPAGSARVLPGAAPLSQVLDETGLELPEGEYATLAGFLLERLGGLPRAGARAEFEGWQLEVTWVDGHRIRWVTVSTPPEEGQRA
jgi:CBS domain containing-hemolysin-like protein